MAASIAAAVVVIQPFMDALAFSYGIRRAAQNRRRAEAENAARAAAKADRKALRAARRAGM